jgi:hypothetical protein
MGAQNEGSNETFLIIKKSRKKVGNCLSYSPKYVPAKQRGKKKR